MRQTISAVVAAIAVMTVSAAPAMACGGLFPGYGGACVQSDVPTQYHGGCYGGCGGWTYERLSDPVQQYHSGNRPAQQYYYVNQGPTFSGPGAFAPYPTYQESAVSGWHAYRRRPVIYSYHAHRHHSWRTHAGYRYRAGPSAATAPRRIRNARCAATTDRRLDPTHWRPFASCARALIFWGAQPISPSLVAPI
jgi:hypothetical protein